MQFLIKLNIKTTIRCIKLDNQSTGQSEIDQTCFFIHGDIALVSVNVLILNWILNWLLKLNNDIKYFIHSGTVLKQGIEGDGNQSHT